MQFLRLLWGTVTLRPYVFVFLAAYLLLALPAWGWRRTALYTVLGYAVAWAAEYSSIHVGFPFGHYSYVSAPTADRELWVAGVPFMDSLSFVFLTFAGLQTVRLLRQPLRRHGARPWDWRWADPAQKLTLWAGAIAGLYITGLDVIIDPVALQGDRWFLGRIYWYPGGGPYFGVPLANFAGWALVSWTVLGLFALLDRALAPRLGQYRSHPADALTGTGLFAGVAAFNLAVTALIGEPLMALAGLAWAVAMLAPLAARLSRLPKPPR
ncbi:MAG: carotenoid biosynthesis protein [Anaerolineae bacterium]